MIWALHGNLGSPLDWRSAGTGPLEAVDVFAVGSDLHGFAAELNQQVRESGDLQPVLLGYSMGGRLALHCLLETGAPWLGAVVVSAHTGLASAEERQDRLGRDRAWAQRLRDEPRDQFWEAWNAQEVFGGGENTTGQAPAPVLDPRGFEEWSLGEQDDLLGSLPGIAVPVLWVTGAEDQKFTEIGTSAAAVLPAGRHVAIPGAHHRVPWDEPEAFRTELDRFVAKLA